MKRKSETVTTESWGQHTALSSAGSVWSWLLTQVPDTLARGLSFADCWGLKSKQLETPQLTALGLRNVI